MAPVSQMDAENDTAAPESAIAEENDVVADPSGIIFISRIPPFMNLSKLKSYFSKFGEIGRVYAVPESITDYKNRVKRGGNSKLKFTHGWIQFMDRRIAKKVAKALNGSPVADGKKHGFYHDDLWNIKYLPKYKWSDLIEYFTKHKRQRTKKLHQVLEECRKQNYEYIEQLQAEKQQQHIAKKKGYKPRKVKAKIRAPPKIADEVPTKLINALLK